MRISISLLGGFMVLTVLGACSSPAPEPVAPTGAQEDPSGAPESPEPTAAPDPADQAAAERDLRRLLTLPPVPSFTVPTELLSTSGNQGIAEDLDVPAGLYDGIAVLDARCTPAGEAAPADAGAAVATGRHHMDDGTVRVTVNGDGTGVYDAPGVHVAVLPEGAGVYDDGDVRLSVSADGSGTYRDGEVRYTVRADGSGSYEDGDHRVWVDADGAGGYDDATTRLSMRADGEVFGDAEPAVVAAVRTVLADGLPRFPPVPAIEAVEPSGTVCGTVIRLDANVLFDVDSADVGPDGSEHLGRVAELLRTLGSPRVRIDGHTDGVGSDAYNLDLSERRAAAVRDVLVAGGVESATLETRGLGETSPLRAETTPEGADDEGARRLNRRVDLVLLD